MLRGTKLFIHTDGGARGNPGPAAIGIVIRAESGKILKKYGEFLGVRTNNEAEYEAVIKALEFARELGGREIVFNMDSELVQRQLNSVYRAKNNRMQELLLRVRNLERDFQKVSYHHVPREKNVLADKLVNNAIDKHETSK